MVPQNIPQVLSCACEVFVDLKWQGREEPIGRGAVALAVGSLGALLVAFLLPAGGASDACILRRLSGLPCPVCGVGRSWYLLAHGAPLEALQQSPLGALLLLLAGVTGCWAALRLLGLVPAPLLSMTRREVMVSLFLLLFLLLLNWAYGLATGMAW